MQTTTKHRLLLGVCLVTVLALSLVTLWGSPNFLVKPQQQNNQSSYESKRKTLEDEYQKLLKETKTDPVASSRILAKVINPADIKKMVDDGLQVSKPVALPQLDISRLKYTDTETADDVIKYVDISTRSIVDFEQTFGEQVNGVFAGDADSEQFSKVHDALSGLVAKLYSVPVPKITIEYHKAQLQAYVVLEAIVNMYEPRRIIEADNLPGTITYHGYLAINKSMYNAQKAADELEKKFSLAYPVNISSVSEKPDSFIGEFLDGAMNAFSVHEAQGFLPGVPQPVIIVAPLPVPNATVVDAPRWVSEALQNKLALAFSSFALKLLGDYAKKIESAFLITNVLYYRDALTSARYTDDFIKKYLPDVPVGSPEANLIRSFIPEIGCGDQISESQRNLINQKVLEYLGFDPEQDTDVTSPDFYEQVNRSGHFAAQGGGTGMELIYRAVADVVGGRARETAETELAIPHKKVPIIFEGGATGGFKTALSLDSISAQQVSAQTGTMQVGQPNATNVGGMVWIASIIDLVRQFMLLGSALKEQATCVAVPVVSPIIPVGVPGGNNNVNVDGLLQCQKNLQVDPNNPDPSIIVNCLNDALGDIVNGANGPAPDRGSPLTGTGLLMDKACYAVGEVPRLAVRGVPPNELIYWSLYSQPSGQAVYADLNFEDAAGPQATDAQGNWPSATGTVPDQGALTTADIGQWTRRARADGQEYAFEYKVVATRNECYPTR